MLISRKEKVGEMVRVSASFSVEALKVSDPYHLLTFHHDASVVEPLSWWPVVAESGQLSNCSDQKKPPKLSRPWSECQCSFHSNSAFRSEQGLVWAHRYTWVLDGHLMRVCLSHSQCNPSVPHKSTQRACAVSVASLFLQKSYLTPGIELLLIPGCSHEQHLQVPS